MFGVFYLTSRVLKAESITIPIFIPICFDLGIILAMASEHAWLLAKDFTKQYYALSSELIRIYYRSMKLAVLIFVNSARGGSENHLPLLPISYPNNSIGSEYTLLGTPTRNSEESNPDETPLPSEYAHTGESFPPGVNPWIR